MSPDPANRGYQTPVMADVETAYRRLLGFQAKVFLAFVAVLVVVGGTIAAVAITKHNQDVNRVVAVPNLARLDPVAASQTLREAGLQRGPVIEKDDASVGFGHVISTEPAAGAQVKAHTSVTLFISCGRRQPGFCPP
jgi:beta-lactam-binding protein with PASTA domain